ECHAASVDSLAGHRHRACEGDRVEAGGRIPDCTQRGDTLWPEAGLMAAHVYDVIIVGSGAAGGTLSAHLAQKGADVAVVEGGPPVNTRTDFNTHAMPF